MATSQTEFKLDNPLQAENLEDIITQVSSSIRELAIPIAVGFYLYAGFLWLTAGAKPNNLTKAKEVFKFTTVGLVIIFIGSGFVSLIKSILNLGQ